MSDSEPEDIGRKCAHVIYHADNASKLQELLLDLDDPLAVLTFPSSTIPKSDRTYLMACARRGRYECCRLLLSLDSASSVNLQNSQGYTALHYASYEGHADVAFLLLAAGADVQIKNVHGETPYETAISGKRVDLVRMYQQSPNFAKYLSNSAFPPTSGSDRPIPLQSTGGPKGILNRRDASYFALHITEVGPGADSALVGCEFACLSSTQQEANRTAATIISGSTHDATARMDGSSEDLYIGRARTNHVCISDLSLSKQHAVISYIEDTGFVVRDIGSKHGTFINDKRLPVDEVANIADGSKVTEEGKLAAGAHRTMQNMQFLKEGMTVRFGRISCTVVRKRQDTVLSSR
jgi:hypothetical protein